MALNFLYLVYGILGGAVYFLCWYRGLEGVTASVAAIFTAVIPVSTVALGYLFLQEQRIFLSYLMTACIELCELILTQSSRQV